MEQAEIKERGWVRLGGSKAAGQAEAKFEPELGRRMLKLPYANHRPSYIPVRMPASLFLINSNDTWGRRQSCSRRGTQKSEETREHVCMYVHA